MLAPGIDQQVPGAFLDEQGRPIVEQEPAEVLELLVRRGLVDGQGEVAAALGRAMVAKALTRLEVLAAGLGPLLDAAAIFRWGFSTHPRSSLLTRSAE
jgi:hypothetical protein